MIFSLEFDISSFGPDTVALTSIYCASEQFSLRMLGEEIVLVAQQYFKLDAVNLGTKPF